jgi:hypothetical protein
MWTVKSEQDFKKVIAMLKNALFRPKSPRENAFFAIFGAILDEIQKMQCPALNITSVRPKAKSCMRADKIECSIMKFTAIHPNEIRLDRGQ